METKWCPRCQQDVPIGNWYRNAGRRDGLSVYCRPCYAGLNADLVRRNRLALLADMGGKCERCGFSDPRALQIDHVNGDGRAETRHRHGKRWAAYVMANRPLFALLCANCNWIKKAEQNETVGARDYGRVPPTERIVRPSRKHAPEVNAARAAAMRVVVADPAWKQQRSVAAKAAQQRMSPESRASRSRKISEARKGTKKGPDGKWYRPNE